MTDADYIYAFQKVVMPIAYQFDPELVIGLLESFFLKFKNIFLCEFHHNIINSFSWF